MYNSVESSWLHRFFKPVESCKMFGFASGFLTLALAALLAVTLLFAGCGKDDGDDPPKEEDGGRLNPPAWFIGKWTLENGGTDEDMTVTAKNVVVSNGNLDFSYQLERDYLTDWKEVLSGNVYTLSYVTKNPAGTVVIYAFEPHTGGKIKRTLTMAGFGQLPQIFIKK